MRDFKNKGITSNFPRFADILDLPAAAREYLREDEITTIQEYIYYKAVIDEKDAKTLLQEKLKEKYQLIQDLGTTDNTNVEVYGQLQRRNFLLVSEIEKLQHQISKYQKTQTEIIGLVAKYAGVISEWKDGYFLLKGQSKYTKVTLPNGQKAYALNGKNYEVGLDGFPSNNEIKD